MHFTGASSTEGTFVASGAIDDAGDSIVVDLARVPFGRDDRARLTGVQTFTSSRGELTTRFDGIASDVSQPHQYGQGRFRIVAATGAYAGLKGHGEFTIVVDAAHNKLIGTETGHVR